MIYTVTLNPAIDVVFKLNDSCRVGKINRAYDEMAAVGGKGINVSRVLKALKRDSIALGLIGGYAGEVIEKDLRLENIKSDFVRIKGGMTRINVKVLRQGPTFEETQINAPGPVISREDIMNLAKKLAKIKKDDIVIISGGMPKTLSLNLFDSFLKFISSRNAYIVVDIFGAPLLKILKYKPFLVNLNEEELADTLYTQVKTEDDCVKGAKRLLKMGAQNVVVMRGPNGAMLINDELTMKVKALKGEVKNTVGAGDSLLAGLADEYLKTGSFDLAIKKGVVVASATVFSDGLANEKSIAEAMKQMK
ncbi:MAG: 1-phosphofructokinase family hexose kinase [Bacilli bacterium]|nr:1-phosphofructokinase family hexose kinase [Bacilli bacterium]